MNLELYEKKRKLYTRFAETVRKILLAAITGASSQGVYKYHLQQIQCRAKTVESLQKRLAEQGKENADNIEEIRKDLAGCRVIFYYNDDVNAFLSSGLVRDNFTVHWEQSHPHLPKEEITSSNDYYTANHYIVELDGSRAALPEYAPYQGLKCEIQIHTVLNHAWAETAHDIIYKNPGTDGFGSRILESIDKRLQKIMKDHLIPVGYEFQKVRHDYNRLLAGKELLGRDVKEEILACKNNNERQEILQRFRESTLPLYDADYITKEVGTIIDIAKTAVLSAKDVKTVDIETPFGSMQGQSFNDVLKVSLNILKDIQYVDVEAVFSALVELYLTVSDDKAREAIQEVAAQLSYYSLDILRQVGFYVQVIILSHLERCDDATLEAIKKLVATVCNAILGPIAQGTSSTYRTITIKRGTLSGNDASSSIRQRALSLLKKLYNTEDEERLKRLMIGAFNTATRTPNMGNCSNELLALILRDTKEVIDFYTSIIPSEKYELLESIEEDMCHLYRRSKDVLEVRKVGDEACWQLCEMIVESAIGFRTKLNEIEEFVIYKTLVGFESVFEESWDNSEWKIHEESDYRDARVEEFVAAISDKNKEYWERIILRCTQTKSEDLATFPYFGKFLNLLAERKPDYMFTLLERHEEPLSGFFTPILGGLLKSSKHDTALALMNAWVEERKHLYICARVFEFYQPFEEVLIRKILTKATETSDVSALMKVMAAAAKNYTADAPHLITELFIPAIQALTQQGNTQWVNDFWYRQERSQVISALDEDGVDIILENLLLLEKIDFHVEEVLVPIAQKYPDKILEFLRARLLTEKEDGELVGAFDAIPYRFHRLNEPLSSHPELVVDMVRDWYDDDYSFFIYRGGRLIRNIFSPFSEGIENKLIELVRTGQERNLLIVMGVLRNYDGNPAIRNVCKELVKILPKDSEFLGEVMIILESTGGVSGEFGFVEAYKRKKQEIAEWLEDTDEKVKVFTQKYIATLDKQILSEKCRAEERIELRKHEFGDDENSDDDPTPSR